MTAMETLPKLLVSDFAGTAMKEEGSVLLAYRTALEEHRIPFSEEDLASRRGANKRAVFEDLAGRVYSGEERSSVAGKALARFEAVLRQEYETGDVREVEGAAAAFTRLREAGLKLVLSSGFERSVVDLLVSRLGWSGLFDAVLAGSDAPAGRPAPYLIYRAMTETAIHDVRAVAVVGDTPLDLQAGTNAGAGWVIGVLSGAHGIETLGATRHTHILASVAGLPKLFGCG